MEKETSCINSLAILNYFEKHFQGNSRVLFENLDPEIDALPDPEAFLKDPNNWISCKIVAELFERAKAILHDDMVAYHIGKYSVENSSLGYIQRIIIKALFSYKMVLKNIQKLNDKLNRSKRIELVDIEGNRAVVRLHWDPTMHITRDICLYNQGTYTNVPLIWGGNPLELKESCCFLKGAPYCEYHIKWPAKNRFHEIVSRFFTPKSVLMDTIMEMEKDKQIIEKNYEEVNRLNVELNQRIKQLLAIQETGKAILSVLNLEKLLTVIMNLLCNVCKINRAVIMLVNEEDKCLEFVHGVGFGEAIPEEVKNYRIPLDRVSNMLVRVASTGRAEYVSDVKSSSLKKENILVSQMQPTSAYVVPLITRSNVIGVIGTDAVTDQGVPKETREILEIFAPQIAIAIANAKLYSTLQQQMQELKRSHTLLSRAEKLSFLGNIAARLAHEIKNPMTSIGTFIQMLPRKFDDEEFRTDFYNMAMEETLRINNLITELLDLVKTKESHFQPEDLHALIDKMILLLSPQSKAKKIEIVKHYDTRIGYLGLDSEKIKQVILNILSNAVDFTPEKGMIVVSTKKVFNGGHRDAVRIEIKDNGPGIPPSIKEKIFDPYFTTKHKSNMHSGTGLGLFIAHQNMQDHGGAIEVMNNEHGGAKFILTLPDKVEN